MISAAYPEYDSFRATAAPNLQQIPSHWEIRRVKYAACMRSEKALSAGSSFPYIGMENVESWSGKILEGSSEVEGLATIFRKEDVLFGKLRPYLAKVTKPDFAGLCSSEFLVFESTRDTFADYLAYALRTSYFINLVNGSTYGAKMPRANPNFVANTEIPFPSLPEQRAIAEFLDEKCAKIDEAVRIKEQQIRLLRERRQILIQQAVTRGLNPDVPMKDSGIDWIGQIPEHWTMRKINHIGMVGNGSTPSRSNMAYWQDGDIPWLNSSKVNDFLITKAEQFVTAKAKRECHLPTVEPGDIVIGITGQGKTRGMVALSKIATTINQHLAYIKIKSPEVSADYLLHFFVASYEWMRQHSESSGSTKGAITCDDIKQYLITSPPVPEQKLIVSHIKNGSEKIDKAIIIKESQISALQEYKATLINAAVTGKIKVVANTLDELAGFSSTEPQIQD